MAADVQYLRVAEADPLGGIVLAGRISTGRNPASSESSATRADRLADLTELKVATASTSVPLAVASDEIVTQSAIGPRPQDGRGAADSSQRPAPSSA